MEKKPTATADFSLRQGYFIGITLGWLLAAPFFRPVMPVLALSILAPLSWGFALILLLLVLETHRIQAVLKSLPVFLGELLVWFSFLFLSLGAGGVGATLLWLPQIAGTALILRKTGNKIFGSEEKISLLAGLLASSTLIYYCTVLIEESAPGFLLIWQSAMGVVALLLSAKDPGNPAPKPLASVLRHEGLQEEIGKPAAMAALGLFLVFLIYTQGTVLMNQLLRQETRFGEVLIVLGAFIYLMVLRVLPRLIKRYRILFSLGFLTSVASSALVLSLPAGSHDWINWNALFLFVAASAGIDVFFLLMVTFLSVRTERPVLCSVGIVLYYMVIEAGAFVALRYQSFLLPRINGIRLFSLLFGIGLIIFLFFFSFRQQESSREKPIRPDPGNIRTPLWLKELTAAERQVFDLFFEGLSNQQIAETLFVSLSTVKFHVRNILKKADAKNKYELLASIHEIAGKAGKESGSF
ncbi:MAG TPA: helix-turn-helix transcriptional regulator [Bacillota bacterium]|nr:helix-turn-helix transcriptional regulator [Bacillota bacterium]